MAYEQPNFSIGIYVAGEDLSSKQWEVVKMTTSGKIQAVTSSGSYLGVLQNNPTSGLEADVMVIGVSKVKAGGAFNKGGRLKVNQAATAIAGALVAVTSGTAAISNNVGIALEAAAQGSDIVAALINFGNV